MTGWHLQTAGAAGDDKPTYSRTRKTGEQSPRYVDQHLWPLMLGDCAQRGVMALGDTRHGVVVSRVGGHSAHVVIDSGQG